MMSSRWHGQQHESESSDNSDVLPYLINRNSLCCIRDTTRTHLQSTQRDTSVLPEDAELSIKEARGLHTDVIALSEI